MTSEPVVRDAGRNWLTLSWTKPEHRGTAPVIAYRVDAWMLGSEGGARWTEVNILHKNVNTICDTVCISDCSIVTLQPQ